MAKKPFINCHTHIFTGDHVPPYLGKTLMVFPVWAILTIKAIMKFVRSRETGGGWLRKTWWKFYKPLKDLSFWWQSMTEHWAVPKLIAWWIRTVMAVVCGFFALSYLRRFFDEKGMVAKFLNWSVSNEYVAALVAIPWYWKLPILIAGIILFKAVRNVLKLILFGAFGFLKTMLGGPTTALLKRYYDIAVLSKNSTCEFIYSVLQESYPADTKFVVLPMDMDHMKAGKPTGNYIQQLDKLKEMKKKDAYKNTLLPFVFADPRRFKEDPGYYDTAIECLEKYGFSGIKIYPALGYYPFDAQLLPLFLYACENEVPITTHCIRGIIYYRGLKKTDWNYHPVFTENWKGKEGYMRLDEFKNIDFSVNFTHPLNYLCLLDPDLFKIVLFNIERDEKTGEDIVLRKKVYALFGFSRGDTPETSELKKDLKNLKLCFGHFGGEDEWGKYIAKDRNSYDNKFALNPDHYDDYKKLKLQPVWKQQTWYSIIRNIIKNPAYPNVYADISFIIYDEAIISLLKSSLQVDHLKDRILYGTDFYVVRQKGTDKKFWLDVNAHLSEKEMDLIARENPDSFLKNKIQPKPAVLPLAPGIAPADDAE